MGEENFNNNGGKTLIPPTHDEDVNFSNNELISDTNIIVIPNSESLDNFFDELLKDTHVCSHAHSCNPPGPDLTHTHSCLHVHTKLLSPATEEKSGTKDDSAEESVGQKRGNSNREAVRKYRQKKKANTASLEDEVIKLRTLNQKLLQKLQGQAELEAEVARLKCLLVDIRGRIEGEIGSFPYNNNNNDSFPGLYMVPCHGQCGDQIYCVNDGKGVEGEGALLNGQVLNGCDFGKVECVASLGSGYSCDGTNVTAKVGSSGNTRRKRFQ